MEAGSLTQKNCALRRGSGGQFVADLREDRIQAGGDELDGDDQHDRDQSDHEAVFDHRGAVFVDKILKGARPAELPVEQATRFELVINMRTAKALGVTIAPSILARADDLLE